MKNKFLKNMTIWTLISGLVLQATPVWALTKDETIYAKLNSNGEVKNSIVSEHISDNGKDIIRDKSKLNDITNVNGNGSYRKDNDELIWETNGKDIYYHGTTKEELPINIKISYYLDDKETDVNDMIGKKGKVKIKLEYNNNSSKIVNVNGKNEKLYTPFVVATVMTLSNDNNKNINISNGKIIDNGINKVIVGIASPGLYDSLKVDKLKGLDEVVISYETDNFELSSIYTAATANLLDESDLDIFNNTNSLYSNINTLSSSSKELVNGSEKLVNGSIALKDGSKKIVNGLDSAYVGSSTISKEVKKAIDKLSSNTGNVLDSKTLDSIVKVAVNSATLTDEQQKQIGTQALNTIKNSNEYKSILSEYNKYTKSVNDATKLYKQASASGNKEMAEKVKSQLEAATVAQTTYKSMMNIMEQTAYKTAISTASQVSKTVAEQVSRNVANQVANKVMEKMSKEVISSLNTLLGGVNELTSGIGTLKNGSIALDNGINELSNGINTLNQGMNKFDKDGIEKISNLVNGDVRNIEGRIRAITKLSNDYQTMDNRIDGTNGNSKIIMVIDEIKNKEVQNNDKAVIEEDNKGLWAKIKGLFRK